MIYIYSIEWSCSSKLVNQLITWSLLKQWVRWAPDLWLYWRRWGAESRVRPSLQNTSCRDCPLGSRGEIVPQFCTSHFPFSYSGKADLLPSWMVDCALHLFSYFQLWHYPLWFPIFTHWYSNLQLLPSAWMKYQYVYCIVHMVRGDASRRVAALNPSTYPPYQKPTHVYNIIHIGEVRRVMVVVVCVCVCVCVCVWLKWSRLGVSRAGRQRNVSMNVMYACILDPGNMTECEEQWYTDFDVHTYTLYILCTAKISWGSNFFWVIKWEHLKCAYTHKILLCKHFNTWESVGPLTLPEGGYSATPQGRKLIYWCLPHKVSTLLHGQEDKASSEQ